MCFPKEIKEHLFKITLTSGGYVIATFTMAVLWHLVIFDSFYESIGYIEGEPKFLYGFLSIAIQAVILSIAYVLFYANRFSTKNAFIFVGLLGLFFWTSHVLAFAAKNTVPQLPLFVGLESVYLMIQFGLFGLLLSIVYKNKG